MDIGVLVVDDQEDIRLLMKMIIDAADQGLFVSAIAGSAAEALDRLDAADPDIVVLDEMMPGGNGIELARAIDERRPGQLMIMCSAHLDADLRRRAKDAGIKVCLTKERVTDLPAALHDLARDG